MKKHIYILFVYLLFTAGYSAHAQTYVIPDINLRNKLISDYPALMNSRGELIIAAAAAISADLELDNSNISNADGLQFFVSTGILKIINNQLTRLPELSSMKNLRRIYVNGNKITSIPDLSALYQLADLAIGNNKITTISGIETKVTLEILNVAGNEITEIPDLSTLVNLKTLSVGFNPLTIVPDLSYNINLLQLDVSNSAINSVPSLPALINLQTFICDKSNFTDLSGLNANTKLIKLSAQNCKITTLPDITNKPNLTTLNVSNNNLTFEDLIPLKSSLNFPAFIYTPQKDVSISSYIDIREQNAFTYQISIDQTITSDKFTWFKNNIPLVTNSTGNYPLTPAFMGDSGTYYVKITNSNLPDLVLKSNISKLIVRPCIEISKINLSVLSSDCREGSLIDVAGTTVDGAVQPVNYILQSTNPVKNITGTSSTQFANIIPGTYVLQATDSRNCTAYKLFPVDKGSDCESVFSPDGDGIMDNYFIPDTGTVQIYNTSKKLIKTLQVPASWDGSTDDGGIADSGYYVIVINESSSIGVSLMR